MAEEKKCESICKSVFKGGENSTTEQDFTNVWIDLINTLEKGKNVDFCEKSNLQPALK